MSTAIVVITDGRGEYLERTIASAEEQLKGIFAPALIIDDSGDAEYANWLEGRFPGFWHVHHAQRQGFGAVVRTAWEKALEHPDVQHIFHLEEDFTFNEALHIGRMAEMLDANPLLAQLVLKRQPWSGDEQRYGGQIEYCEARGDTFEEWHVSTLSEAEEAAAFLGYCTTHRINFSTNPSLLTRKVAELCVATGEPCTEGLITKVCLDANLMFAYLGRKADPPRCHHIGDHRSEGWSE